MTGGIKKPPLNEAGSDEGPFRVKGLCVTHKKSSQFRDFPYSKRIRCHHIKHVREPLNRMLRLGGHQRRENLAMDMSRQRMNENLIRTRVIDAAMAAGADAYRRLSQIRARPCQQLF
jgi:hypothetical protein